MSWRIEDRLILNLCLPEKKDNEHLYSSISGSSIDWSYFLSTARKNGVSPIIYYNTKNSEFFCNLIPTKIIDALKQDYYEISRQNTLISEEVSSIIREIQGAGIRIILLKGIVLAESVYKNIALRPIGDIDILIRNDDYSATKKALSAIDYYPIDSTNPDLTPEVTPFLNTYDFRKKDSQDRLSLHLHWHLVNSSVPSYAYIYKIDMDRIWKETQKISINGIETLTLSLHHQLIYLSEHGFRNLHSFARLIQLCDIAWFIERYKSAINYDLLILDAERFNLNRFLFSALVLVKEYFGLGIAPEVMDRLKPHKMGWGERVFMKFSLDNYRLQGLSYLVHLSMNHGLIKKSKFIFDTFFPPSYFVAQRKFAPEKKTGIREYIERIREVLSVLFKIIRRRS